MHDNSIHMTSLKELLRDFPMTQIDNLADDFVIAKLEYNESMNLLRYPCRFDGYMAIFCKKGNFAVDINLRTFEISSNSLMIYFPGNIVKLHKVEELTDAEFYVVAVSTPFLKDVKVNFAKLYEESIAAHNNPCIQLNETESSIVTSYYELAESLAGAQISDIRGVVQSLTSSVFLLLGELWSTKLEGARSNLPRHTLRAQITVDTFMKLVSKYHLKEHYLAFYADKMCLSTKYLSKLVKTVTGRSAPEWIDSYLVLEAKNLLKYSDIPLKEIVYKLNFPDQSSFYRFFKLHTGMVPSEYRKS